MDWDQLGGGENALRSSWPQCRQRVLRRAFSVPHFPQVRYMARAKKWVRVALTPRIRISKAIRRNAWRIRFRPRGQEHRTPSYVS
jgi:hypothetical protein